MKEAKTGLGDQRTSVIAHAADGFGHPGRVAGEQLVIFGRAQETDNPELDYEIVNDFLGLRFVECAFGEIALEVDVEKGGNAPKRHRRAVLLFDGGQVSKIEPLN